MGRAYPCPFGAPSGIYCGRGSPKGTSWRKVGRCPFGARAIYCPKGPRRGNDFPGSPLWGPSRCPEGAIAKRGMRVSWLCQGSALPIQHNPLRLSDRDAHIFLVCPYSAKPNRAPEGKINMRVAHTAPLGAGDFILPSGALRAESRQKSCCPRGAIPRGGLASLSIYYPGGARRGERILHL